MKILLAPMEGLADDILRRQLTAIAVAGAARMGLSWPVYDQAVTEFVRISGNLLPQKLYTRVCPELDSHSRTPTGVPVAVQLLGSDPISMQENAAFLSTLSPAGIDLNFGCPAPTVNRHQGGAVLLDFPQILNNIVSAVRRGVPEHIPLTAKMRLGVRDAALAVACAQAIADGGAQRLVIHARTKEQAYRPPAHWAEVARVAATVAIPVIPNGEVWQVDDWQRCRAESDIGDIMIGRGAVANPFLAVRLRAAMNGIEVSDTESDKQRDWLTILPYLGCYWQEVLDKLEHRFAPGRLKQWLKYLALYYPQAARLFADLRTISNVAAVAEVLRSSGALQVVEI